MNPKEPKTALPEARKATVADSHGLELGFCSSPPSYASCFLVRCNLHFGVWGFAATKDSFSVRRARFGQVHVSQQPAKAKRLNTQRPINS